MIKKILGAAMVFLFFACQKESVKTLATQGLQPDSLPAVAALPLKTDTLPDMAYFKLKMMKDSFNYDETAIMFDHLATLNYDQGLDSPYFKGWGAESFFSLSDDGMLLAINRLPYKNGLVIPLGVESQADGLYVMKMNGKRGLPADLQIWLKDAFMKDSTNLSSASYSFQVNKIDTASYGKSRFKLCLRCAQQQ
jgi:hypothetical protein